MYNNILIATDGSELARKGVDHGLNLAKALGARITVLTVTEPLSSAALAEASVSIKDPRRSYERQMDEYVEALATRVKDKAATIGVAVTVARETDNSPSEAIVRAAKLADCDLIIMASHGRRGVQKLLLGSQTAAVLAHTTIPVLVVR
jgi:nucleotide-binding universal stress UspA family protein